MISKKTEFFQFLFPDTERVRVTHDLLMAADVGSSSLVFLLQLHSLLIREGEYFKELGAHSGSELDLSEECCQILSAG